MPGGIDELAAAQAASAGRPSSTRRSPDPTASSWIARRPAIGPRVWQAIAAGKHIHIEKPTAPTVDDAMELARLADKAGLKHGVIQDKLFLPGFAKLLFVKKRASSAVSSRSRSMPGRGSSTARRRNASGRAGTTNSAEGGGHRARYDGALALHDRPSGVADHRRCARHVDSHPPEGRRRGQPYNVDAEDTSTMRWPSCEAARSA